MVKKQEMPFLEDLVKEGHITDSDSEILRLFNENEDLKVLQSKDTYNWYENTGKTECILSMLIPKKITYLDKRLDLFLVDKERLKEAGKSYSIESNLNSDDFSKKDSIPNLKHLDMFLSKKGSSIDLKDYSLIKTERYIEYPDKIDGRENLTKSILARLYDSKRKNGLTLVYRQTINDGNVIGSRIYLSNKKSGLEMLDKEENLRLVSFMAAIDYWHDNKLKEGEKRVSKFGEGPNLPSYLSLYY